LETIPEILKFLFGDAINKITGGTDVLKLVSLFTSYVQNFVSMAENDYISLIGGMKLNVNFYNLEIFVDSI
jgi:hypothetical protein